MALPKVADADPNNRRALLAAILKRLIAELDGDAGHRRACECKCGVPPDSRTVPTLAKELRELIREIDTLPGGEEADPVDDLAAQRAARLARAAGQ